MSHGSMPTVSASRTSTARMLNDREHRRNDPTDDRRVVEHMQHVIDTVGEKLARGWCSDRIREVIGGNFLRAFALLRP